MRLFIFAERTGDFELHLHCVEKIIPIFHSSNHFPYAKSARQYFDTMRELPQYMPEEQYKTFVKEGYFTIRRSHRFWSGIFSDQTIEQVLMRNLKAPGGLAPEQVQNIVPEKPQNEVLFRYFYIYATFNRYFQGSENV